MLVISFFSMPMPVSLTWMICCSPSGNDDRVMVPFFRELDSVLGKVHHNLDKTVIVRVDPVRGIHLDDDQVILRLRFCPHLFRDILQRFLGRKLLLH